jgi:hypothetical protein
MTGALRRIDYWPPSVHLVRVANAKMIAVIDAELSKARRELLLNIQTIEHMLLDNITTLTERVDQLRKDVDELMGGGGYPVRK